MNRFLFFFISLSIVYCLLPTEGFAQTPNFSYTQTCYGSQTTLVASSSLPDTSISIWQWDLDGNGSYEMTGKTIISLITQNDTIAVRLKIKPKTGAADSITKNVTIDPLPLVNFIANNLCESRSATYASQSSILTGAISQFLWDFNNDGITDDNSNDTVNYTCGPAQTYVTKLTCISSKGCSAFSQKTTTVYPNPIAAYNVANTCFGNNTMFTNGSTAVNLDYYSWNYGDGMGNIAPGNTNHMYAAAGNYNVQLIAVTQAGCRDTASSVVMINPNPVAALQFSGDTTFFEGASVMITATGGTNYLWSTGDVLDNITVTQSGTYSCHVTDANGCFADVMSAITVKEIPDSVKVSAFILTPNNDNINDVLMIEDFAAYTSCDLRIYSMWNEEVFNVKGYKNDWKGTNANGGNLPAGSYYYIIQCDDKTMLKGNINILR